MRNPLAAVVLAAGIPFAALAVAPASLAAAKPAAKPAAKAGGGDLKNGQKIYEAACAMCHGTLAAKKPTLPNAADFFKGRFPRSKGDPKDIARMIKLGGAGYGKGASPQMPPQPQLSEKDLKDVTAFIKSLEK